MYQGTCRYAGPTEGFWTGTLLCDRPWVRIIDVHTFHRQRSPFEKWRAGTGPDSMVLLGSDQFCGGAVLRRDNRSHGGIGWGVHPNLQDFESDASVHADMDIPPRRDHNGICDTRYVIQRIRSPHCIPRVWPRVASPPAETGRCSSTKCSVFPPLHEYQMGGPTTSLSHCSEIHMSLSHYRIRYPLCFS